MQATTETAPMFDLELQVAPSGANLVVGLSAPRAALCETSVESAIQRALATFKASDYALRRDRELRAKARQCDTDEFAEMYREQADLNWRQYLRQGLYPLPRR